MGLPQRGDEGFTLIELAITMVVIGLMLAVGLASYHTFSQDQQLRGSVEAVVGNVQLARVRAISTGTAQSVSFDSTVTPAVVRSADATHAFSWPLPKGVQFVNGAADTFTLTSDGRASHSRYIVLRNSKGRQDTVSVETSGLVLAR